MPTEKGMAAFWGFLQDDGGGPAPDMNEFPYYSAAGLASWLPSSLAPAGAVVKAESGSPSMIDHLHAVSGADFGGGGGEDDEVAPELGQQRLERKRPPHGRHTPQQIQELQRVCLRPSQVKFWFQNRRTQIKVIIQFNLIERSNTSVLYLVCASSAIVGNADSSLWWLILQEGIAAAREQAVEGGERQAARRELVLREAMTRPVCGCCGGPVLAMLEDSPSLEEERLRVQNATLRIELSRSCALASAFLGRSVSSVAAPPTPGSPVDRIGSVPATTVAHSTVTEFTGSPSSQTVEMAVTTMAKAGIDESVFLELATSAMDELVKMAQMDEPLWIPNALLPGSLAKATLNHEEYLKTFSPSIGVKPPGFVSEASRESGIVASDGSFELVETLLDERQWSSFFSCIIAESSTIEEISTGAAGSRDGALLLVTWVEHTVYDESSIHQLYRPLLRSGLALGAGRWLSTLQRQYECLDVLMPKQDASDAMLEGSRSLLRLAERMMENFSGDGRSSAEWSKLDDFTGSIGEDVRIMARRSVDEPGVPPGGVVVCAATSVWMLVTPKRLFNFLCNEGTRAEWDILSRGGSMQEVTKIYKGQLNGNAVSLLKGTAPNTHQDSSILVLQETCMDASGSMVVYTPVDIPAMRRVMGGEGDPASIMLLPSGFVILPGVPGDDGGHKACGPCSPWRSRYWSRQPTGKLTVESVQTVGSLISCTINRIKTALRCDA
ncbi:hypothetical protein ZWY2020_013829 [Hordeum vulgare]|nr:hypothetical protein ZWY2020_013829 [Hordeum vulgare]